MFFENNAEFEPAYAATWYEPVKRDVLANDIPRIQFELLWQHTTRDLWREICAANKATLSNAGGIICHHVQIKNSKV